MNRRRKRCRRANCEQEAASDGLCTAHAEEEHRESVRHDQAVAILHGSPTYAGPSLRGEFDAELRQLRRWWWRSCDAVNLGRAQPSIPLDEAEYAVAWCIKLAEALLIANEQALVGQDRHPELENARRAVWERFENLERGLRSNGLPRGP